MKYNENNKPLECMMTQSTCYKGTTTMTVKGVLWHSTGVNNPYVSRYVQPDNNAPNRQELINIIGKNKYGNDWNHVSVQAGLNCWIGKLADGTVSTVQTMPWNYRPWGCYKGNKGSCNNGWIQFEICEDNLANQDYFSQIYAEACEITAYLCKMYNIDPYGTVKVNGVNVPTILCHYDSYKLGFGSAHADITHWFPKYGKSMATARDDVAKLLAEPVNPIGPANPEEEEEMTQEQFDAMMNDYLARLAEKPATWEQPAMDWAQTNGIILGDDKGRTMPKKFLTRGEMATMLQRFAEKM